MTQPRVFIWNGGTRYGCPLCRWDTGDREAMAEHLAIVHQVAISAPAETVRRKVAATKPSEPTDITVAVEPIDEEA